VLTKNCKRNFNLSELSLVPVVFYMTVAQPKQPQYTVVKLLNVPYMKLN